MNFFSMVSGAFIMMAFMIMLSSWLHLSYLLTSIFELSMKSGPICLDFTIITDWMSLLFISVMILISGSVVGFSKFYMGADKTPVRFLTLLSLFVVSMVCLIISPNMVSILLGWDGLGLTSYLLVVYYQSDSSANAGMLTILSNRVGDAAFLGSIGLASYLGSFNFVMVSTWNLIIITLLVLAAFTKSAQAPFSAWLPAAMSAPTPVSALVHSSTLVTAGVYLLIRLSPGLSVNTSMLLFTGMFTMISASVSANLETDFKKIIALSTLSQLGLMVTIIGLGLPNLAFFHLLTHALFKSSLFICSGLMIHSSMDSQDSRVFNVFSVPSPLLCSLFTLTNMALMGFFFLAGFFSKDTLIESSLHKMPSLISMTLLIIGATLTITYSFRSLYLSLTSFKVCGPVSNVSEADNYSVKFMMPLILASLFGGAAILWATPIGMSPMVLSNSEKMFTSLSMLLMLACSLASVNKSNFTNKTPNNVNLLFKAVCSIFFLSAMSKFSAVPGLAMANKSMKLSDKGWLQFKITHTIYSSFYSLSISLQLASKSSLLVSHYWLLLFFMAGLCLFY